MATKTLEDLCEFITDGTHQTPEYCEHGGYLFLSSKDVTDRRIDWEHAKRIPASLHENLYARLSPRKNDILLAKNGTTGVAAIVDRDEVFDVYVSLAVLRPKRSVFPLYLLYAINSPAAKRQFNAGLKGVGVPNLHLSVIRKTVIQVPSYAEQVEVCERLNVVSQIIENREKALAALDDLIKARFVEMFGDPIINPKGYPIVPISELFDVGSSKRVFESEWRDSGIPFYRAREIVKLSRDGFVNNELFIEEELYEKYKSKYGVPKAGDMMVTGVGTLGVCYIVQPHDRFYFKDGNTLWFKNKGKCSVRFILEQYGTDFVRKQIEANANVSTVGTYTITNANNTMVLVPSLEEQYAFDAFVEQVDKSKSAVQKALDEAQTLFDSLMQKYFG